MKIPKQVTILGRKFAVLNDLSPEQMRRLSGDDTVPMGMMKYSDKQILILKHHCKNEQVITFLHEVNHIMRFTVGLNQITNKDLAEIWCESSANAMFDVIKSMK